MARAQKKTINRSFYPFHFSSKKRGRAKHTDSHVIRSNACSSSSKSFSRWSTEHRNRNRKRPWHVLSSFNQHQPTTTPPPSWLDPFVEDLGREQRPDGKPPQPARPAATAASFDFDSSCSCRSSFFPFFDQQRSPLRRRRPLVAGARGARRRALGGRRARLVPVPRPRERRPGQRGVDAPYVWHDGGATRQALPRSRRLVPLLPKGMRPFFVLFLLFFYNFSFNSNFKNK